MAVYDNVYVKTGIQNFFNGSLIFLLIGGYGAVGLLLILLARTSFRNLRTNDVRIFSFFGIASFCFSIFMIDSMYRSSTLNLTLLLNIRKLSFLGLYLGIYFLLLGINRYLSNKTTPKWVMVIYSILGLSAILAPGYKSLYYVTGINHITIFITIFYILKLTIFSRKNAMVFSGTLLALCAVQSILIDATIIDGAYLYHYGLFIYMMSFTFIVAYKYSNIEQESIALSRKVVLDAMTGAYNRAYLSTVELIDNDLALFIDIDKFKRFNDTYGHDMGDALLCDLVRVFKKVIGNQLEIIRYGGDEFVIILREYEKESVESVLGAIKAQLQATYDDADFSYGYIEYDGNLTDTLIKADQEMYEMKKHKHEHQ